MTKFKAHPLLSLLLALVMVVTMLPVTALAADEQPDLPPKTVCTDENCTHEHGDDAPSETTETETELSPQADPPATPDAPAETPLVWTLEADGTLYISGGGYIEPISSADEQPWREVREQITGVKFDLDAPLEIYDLHYWFEGCVSLSDAAVPVYVAQIAPIDFADCGSLVRLTYGGVDVLAEITADYDNQIVEIAPETVDSGISLFSSSSCGVLQCTCTGSCSWGYRDYRVAPESNDRHIMTVYCATCGRTDGVIVSGSHSYSSNGHCSLCGYYNSAYDQTAICYHYSTYKSWSGCSWTEYCSSCGAYLNSGTNHGITYTTWNGCNWYEYCRDCGQLMDSGTSHSYSYGSWQYYNTSQHRRNGTCSSCGTTTYSYGYHSTTTKYSPYNSTQHSYGRYCSTCDSYVGSVSYANHSLTYGSWTNYTASQHRRTVSCSTCGYSDYEYANHSFTIGAWASISETQHQRTKTCSCGYSTTETASHNLTYGAWQNYSASQHQRTVSCSTCGYSDYEYASHSLTTGAWTSISDTQHQRTNSCSCGHNAAETDTHADTDSDGYCDDCEYLMSRFSVTVPASMAITVSKYGEVYTAENAAIVNNSTGAVNVSTVSFTAQNGWTLVPYSSNMANAKVDSKLIGFSVGGFSTAGNGSYESLAASWEIPKNTSLPLSYDAVVSAMSQPVSEQVLTVVFVLEWSES